MKLVQFDFPIGIFDSGVGGLTVAAAIREHLPNESIIYFGDTARCPYGDKSPAEVLNFSVQVCDFLVHRGIKLLVVACNTATAVALPTLQERYSIPVIGVIEPGANAAVEKSVTRRVGVIGTSVTVSSGAYERAVKQLDPDAFVFSLACPRFVPLVERGETAGPIVEQLVHESLAPLFDKELDSLILGCTHYPLLQTVIGKVMGSRVTLISSAERTAVEVDRVLSRKQLHRSTQTPGGAVFFTTGDGRRMRAFLAGWLHIAESEAVIRMVLPASLEGTSSQFGL